MIRFFAIVAAVVVHVKGQSDWWSKTLQEGKACMVTFYSDAGCKGTETGRDYSFKSYPEKKGGVSKSASVKFLNDMCTSFGYGTNGATKADPSGCHDFAEPMELYSFWISALGDKIGSCTVRLHRSPNCDNTLYYYLTKSGQSTSDVGDVLWQWTGEGEYKSVTWSGFSAWLRENDGKIDKSFNYKIIKAFENKVKAVSFTGNCAHVEVFDEDAWDEDFVDVYTRLDNTPSASTLTKFGVMPYKDNCKFENGDIRTNHACYWACMNKNGCPGKTANCITLRGDLADDIMGVFMRPKNAPKIGEEMLPGRLTALLSDVPMRMAAGVMAMVVMAVGCGVYMYSKNL